MPDHDTSNPSSDGTGPTESDASTDRSRPTDSTTRDDSAVGSERGRPRLRQAAKITGLLVLIAVVLPFVAFAVPQAVGADHSLVVLSGSMEPSISPGDVVFVSGVDPAEIEEGDVITYQRSESGSPTTHRVIEVEDAGDDVQFRTKGDANEDPDQSAVSPDQLVGRVTLTIPVIGHVIAFVNTPLGFGLLVVLPLIAFVLSEAWTILRSRRGADDSSDGGSTDEAPTDENSDDGSVRDRHSDTNEAQSTSQPTSEPESPSPDRYELTKRDLTLSMGVLGVLVAYSGWTAYTGFSRTGSPGIVSMMVFTGSATTLLLSLAARVTLPDGAEPSSALGSSDTLASTDETEVEAEPHSDGDADSVIAHVGTGSIPMGSEADAGDTARKDDSDDLAARWQTQPSNDEASDALLGDVIVNADRGGDGSDE